MKPVSYQTMPSSMNGGHLALDRVLSIPNVLHCEKCGFASTDAAVFKKHMNEHAGTRFYCFYCNDVSFSESELNAHMKQHTEKYPYKCPHCGQGYMRRLCLLKHIDRLHSNGNSYGPAKPGTAKNPHVPVSGALSSVPTVDLTSLRPVVRVTVPTSSAPAFRLDKEEQRGKTRDINATNATGKTELSPLNGLIQHDRALTVSLPEEVTIPAGCLVELVEVKTVNGTKELKLRLISQQENESVIKDTRTAVCQNTASEKQLSSTLNHSKSMSLGMCTINKKHYETKTPNVDRPTVVPISISKNLSNQTSNSKIGLKRSYQDVINLECQSILPNKTPKIFNPVREGNGAIKVAQREPVNPNAVSPSAALTRVINRSTSTLPPQSKGTGVSQRAVEERKNVTPEHSKIISARGGNNSIKSIPRDVPMPVKLEPDKSHLKNNAASLSVSLPGAGQRRPPTVSICNNNVTNHSFSVPRTLNEPTSYKTPVLSNHTNTKIPAWNKEVHSDEPARKRYVQEPEGFPVISSVFSLSQQPEDEKGSIQPLVMALRGIVMDKSNRSVDKAQDHPKTTDSTEQVNKSPTSGYCAPMATQIESSKGDPVLTEVTGEPAQVESCHKGIQHPPALTHSHVKVEEKSIKHTDDKCSHTPQSKSLNEEEFVSKTTAEVDASGTTADPQPPLAKSENDTSSKFLTVSLKRVQLGVWKKNKKGLKLRISKYKSQVSMDSLTDYTVIYPMPLKVDQLVKRPGPNQPVVVLNHPKPRASIQGASTHALADMGASEVVPKCQILKMRLSKVMGQKYEVMGCTVGDFP